MTAKNPAAIRSAYILLYLLLPLLLITAIWHINPSKYSSPKIIPMMLGALAYTMMNMQLIIASRPKWLEKWFGMDQLYRIHGSLAVIAIAAALIHRGMEPRMAFIPWLSPAGSTALSLFIITSLLAVLFLTPFLRRLLPASSPLFRITGLAPFRYHIQRWIHNITVIAAVIMFIHVMLTPTAKNWSVQSLYILYFGTALSFYLYHRLMRPRFFRHLFAIDQVIPESDQMTTLRMHPVKGSVFSYKPGQFAYFSFRDPALTREEHPFSITSQPGCTDSLSITIKDLGDWTSQAKHLSPGSTVHIDAPYGRLSPLLYPCLEGMILMAAGAGITPMMSIIRYYRETDPLQKILLFWMVPYEKDLICKEEWLEIQTRMTNFTLVPIVSRDPSFPGETGHITPSLIRKYAGLSQMSLSNAQIFICGPANMQNTCVDMLHELHVNNRLIHKENFSF